MNRRKFVEQAASTLVPFTFFTNSFLSGTSIKQDHKSAEFNHLIISLEEQMSIGLHENDHLKAVSKYLDQASPVRLQEINGVRTYSFLNPFDHKINCKINAAGIRSYSIEIS
jgi:hypothetical protein